MEIVLLIVAAGVVCYLYFTLKNYLNNPVARRSGNYSNDDSLTYVDIYPDPDTSRENKLRDGEYGVLVRILGKLACVGNKDCIIGSLIVRKLAEDVVDYIDLPKDHVDKYVSMYNSASEDDIEDLASGFVKVTKGEYKKRLKLVEIMFALAYSDGEFTEEKDGIIIDVAAIFELDSEEFNAMRERFVELGKQSDNMSVQRALDIIGLKEEYSQEELRARLSELVPPEIHNIVNPKSLSKNYGIDGGGQLVALGAAYKKLTEVNRDDN